MTQTNQEARRTEWVGPLSQIILPKLGDQMEEGKVARWLKREGDVIQSGEPLVVVEVAQVLMTLGASQPGTLWRICEEGGAVVPAGTLLALERPEKPLRRYRTFSAWQLFWTLMGFMAGGVVLGMLLMRLLLGPS